MLEQSKYTKHPKNPALICGAHMKVKKMALEGKNLPRGKIPITFVLEKSNTRSRKVWTKWRQ